MRFEVAARKPTRGAQRHDGAERLVCIPWRPLAPLGRLRPLSPEVIIRRQTVVSIPVQHAQDIPIQQDIKQESKPNVDSSSAQCSFVSDTCAH